MKIYAPNFNCLFEKDPKMFLPPSLLNCMHYKYYSVKHETGPTGVAAGLQAWDWEGWHPALRWHAGGCSTKSWWWSLTSLQLTLIPNSKAQSVCRMSTIHCPTSIFNMRNGKHYFCHHLLFPTTCSHHHCFNCPPIQGFLGEACSCKQWEEGKGPQYPKSPLGKSHTLYGSISAFLWSSRILPLNNTDTDSQLLGTYWFQVFLCICPTNQKNG